MRHRNGTKQHDPGARDRGAVCAKRSRNSAQGASWIVDGFVFRGHEDLEELAVVRPSDDRVAYAGWLNPARPGDQPLRPDPLEICLEPALQAVDHRNCTLW